MRTLERHQKDKKPLSPVQSDRLLRYAHIAARAEEVFEDTQVARNWLKRSNRALGGEIPLNLMDTEARQYIRVKQAARNPRLRKIILSCQNSDAVFFQFVMLSSCQAVAK